MAYNIEETREVSCAVWLETIQGLGRTRLYQLVELAGSAQKAYQMAPADIAFLFGQKISQKWKKHKEQCIPEQLYKEYIEKGIQYTFYRMRDFPHKLQNIPDPPFGIYYRGTLPGADRPSVAMIGARKYSDYGRCVAEQFASFLGKNQITVISGMALGVDGISQRAALKAGGISYGVLGCGVDVVYPEANRTLYEDLIRQGGVISEYSPGTAPKAGLFPQRNRIISALADVILVVEARPKSGTLITVDMALEQGKEVYVIPGRCTDQLSMGCNRLLRQGALAATCAEDIMQDMGWQQIDCIKKTTDKQYENLSRTAADILAVLDVLPCTREDIITALADRRYGYSVSQICQGITELELEGLAARVGGQYKRTQL